MVLLLYQKLDHIALLLVNPAIGRGVQGSGLRVLQFVWLHRTEGLPAAQNEETAIDNVGEHVVVARQMAFHDVLFCHDFSPCCLWPIRDGGWSSGVL